MEKLINPFEVEGNWYKGNTHTHTTRSDGKIEPQDKIKQYADAGYDFLALTDHFRTYDPTEFDALTLTLIPGIEFHPQHPTSKTGPWHMIALDVDHQEDKFSGEVSAQLFVDKFKKQGGFMILCHPNWCGFSRQELTFINGMDAFEVYNYTCEVNTAKGDSSNEYDSMLMNGHQLTAIACDDSHQNHDAFGGWLKVKAKDSSKESIMEALRSGAYYASSGPDFKNIKISDDKISVETTPVKSIKFIGYAQSGKLIKAEKGSFVEEGEFEIPKYNSEHGYVRVQIEDEEGGKAWSQPVFTS
ncbi:MAG: hypothetical protein COA79_08580 [Planctomycetota bacterium]|nr:MAG: hypothetical protein COA79_08580 [Planctomycetota bacterium]